MTNERSANPKVSDKEMLDTLSAIVGAADAEGAMDRRDHEAIQVIRVAIEERGRLKVALEQCLYYLPSFGEPRGVVRIDGQEVDIRRHVTNLLNRLNRDFDLDEKERP